MRVTTVVGLAAIGGLLYAHKRHGGEWTVDSLKQSAMDLFGVAKQKARDIREQAQQEVHDVARNVADATSRPH
jgi:hypothetical protein